MEESKNLGLREDVWEYAKVDAKALESIKVHLKPTIGVVLVEGQHRLVNDGKQVDNALIL